MPQCHESPPFTGATLDRECHIQTTGWCRIALCALGGGASCRLPKLHWQRRHLVARKLAVLRHPLPEKLSLRNASALSTHPAMYFPPCKLYSTANKQFNSVLVQRRNRGNDCKSCCISANLTHRYPLARNMLPVPVHKPAAYRVIDMDYP